MCAMIVPLLILGHVTPSTRRLLWAKREICVPENRERDRGMSLEC